MTTPHPQPGLRIACQEVVELVTDYLEGVLEPEQSAEVEAHLQLCEGCAEYLEQMRETIRLLGTVPIPTLSAAAQAELVNAFRRHRHQPPNG